MPRGGRLGRCELSPVIERGTQVSISDTSSDRYFPKVTLRGAQEKRHSKIGGIRVAKGVRLG